MDLSEARAYAPPPDFERVRLTLTWDGRNFVGWQSQAAGRSVQDTLHEALTRLSDCARPVAAGRTDAGVHALAMPAHVDLRAGTLKMGTRKPGLERLPHALNALLPRDVAVLEADLAAPGFHARFSARSRSYVYRVLRAPLRRPLEEGRALLFARPLDLEAMRAAAGLLQGRHDFAAFATREERRTVREVLSLEVVEVGEVLELRVTGESFLRHMVRAIVGTLLLVGEGKLAPQRVTTILAQADRGRAGPNVPPHGLYFAGAEY